MGSTEAYKYLPSSTLAPQPWAIVLLSFSSPFHLLTLLIFIAMPMKRNRVATEDELTLLVATKTPQQQPPPPSQNQAKVQKKAEVSNPPKLGEFLERCHYCKKYMREGFEVFMYRDFCGFCSIGCRDIQISIDKLAEKQVASCKDNVDQCKGMADMKSQYSYK